VVVDKKGWTGAKEEEIPSVTLPGVVVKEGGLPSKGAGRAGTPDPLPKASMVFTQKGRRSIGEQGNNETLFFSLSLRFLWIPVFFCCAWYFFFFFFVVVVVVVVVAVVLVFF